jgi:hypothetical protein
LSNEELNRRKISRQHRRRHFLMLELMIALLLVTLCALPLAQLPTKALLEETNAAYRMQLHRYADLAFAEFKEQLYQQGIPWEKICSLKKAPIPTLEGNVTIAFAARGEQVFHRTATLKSVGKKGKNGEECRLVTCDITFKSLQKSLWLTRTKKKGVTKPLRTFTYRLLVKKAGLVAEAPQESAPPNPVKDIAQELSPSS